jgi:sigma-B regulation protein RsbU (phosphoserine phosphatase)
MLFRKSANNNQIQRLEVGGTVVGLIDYYPFVQDSILLEPGDLLVLYTDGISEAMDPQDDEWGEERMIEAIKACQCYPAERIIENLMASADAFVSGAPQHDDMTLVVIKLLDNHTPLISSG